MLTTPQGRHFTAADIDEFVACAHLSWLERELERGTISKPPAEPDPMRDILAKRGREREAAYLAEREASVAVARGGGSLEATRAAMASGAAEIYQAGLANGSWSGIADFLQKVDRASELGAWSYEVADTKLASHAKPYHILQLSLYSQMLEAMQGVAPESMHVVLGTGPQPFKVRDFAAYFRMLQARLQALLSGPETAEPYPLPIEHCTICRWKTVCAARREKDDHLSGVANIRKVQITRLEAAGITTMAELGVLPEDRKVPRIPRESLATLRQQARLQVEQRADGTPRYELLPPQAGKGFALLPSPSSGDVFFDMESDPYYLGGLEYLFGVVTEDGGFRAFWAHTREAEKAAFEAFIDFVMARRAKDPAMHVYHYAPYEPTALKRLAGRHATREEALDDLLRGNVFVDLYAVVRQGLRASFPGYSIKDLEPFYMEKRSGAVKDAGASIVVYEEWLDTKEQALLDGIERYNEDDCVSTRKLRDWLLARAAESRAQFGEPAPPPEKPAKEKNEDAVLVEKEKVALADALLAAKHDGGHLLAHLLDYHRREERPAWWMFFARMQMLDEQLHDDTESIADLTPLPGKPEPDKRSFVYAFTFPAQDFKLRAGDAVMDPATGDDAGTIVEARLDGHEGFLKLKRGPKLAGVPLPTAIVPGGPYGTKEQRAALRRLAKYVVAHGLEGPGPYRALRDLLRNEPPRVRGLTPGAALQGKHVDIETAWPVASGLDDSTLVVQGPPGAGKTYLGARLIVRLLREGRKVGVTALSHRAIHNLLHEVEKVAHELGFSFTGLKKGSDDDETGFRSKLETPLIRNTKENPTSWPEGVGLLAGTAWLFSREDLDQAADYLFIDEAGQVALADALAVGTSSRNLVLLGDPNQLPQVSQGTHPEGAAASVLQHVLGEDHTIPPERGLFLEQSWRMHPDVCAFISELAYDGRLTSAPGREKQSVNGATGLRWLPVEHRGNAQRSPEEAEAIAREYAKLLGGTFIDHEGNSKTIGVNDILVVTPYNAQVQAVLAALPGGAQVGTVDKFQGREAAVVFFSMATSSGDDMPRDLEFLFSRNRLNVAISRARALAVLVASPRLLQVACKTVNEMRLVNGVARFVEFAR